MSERKGVVKHSMIDFAKEHLMSGATRLLKLRCQLLKSLWEGGRVSAFARGTVLVMASAGEI